MLDAALLEAAVLEFRHKSFSFERLSTAVGTEFAVFSRRETETESKLRPKVIRLYVIVPRRQLLYEEETESLWISVDGLVPGPRESGTAQEAGAEAAEFQEQGLFWKRTEVPDGMAYVPRDRAAELDSPEGLAALGFGA
jgi:hypothetical protein